MEAASTLAGAGGRAGAGARATRSCPPGKFDGGTEGGRKGEGAGARPSLSSQLGKIMEWGDGGWVNFGRGQSSLRKGTTTKLFTCWGQGERWGLEGKAG